VFFSGAALLMLAVIAYGFAPSFYMRGWMAPRDKMEPLIALVVLHGVLFTVWMLLFVAQSCLVAAGRVDLHRRLGTVGFVLLPALALVAVFTSLGGVGRPLTAPEGIDPLSWLAKSLFTIPVFSILIALGLINRGRPRLHKRFMYIGMVSILAPGFGRMPLPLPPEIWGPVATMLLPDLFLLALMAWDVRSTRRPHAVTLAGSAGVLTMQVITPVVWTTPAWLHFAAWASSPFR
jgi:uncharacterized membrane protein YozB (DUF420 family)